MGEIPIVRSWPMFVTPDRMRVDDHLARITVQDYDFVHLKRYFHHDGVIHLDWDVAVDYEDLMEFRRQCAMEPDVARIIPYRLYEATTGEPGSVWAHVRNPWTFGCIFLPGHVLRRWQPMSDEGKLNDTTVMLWASLNGIPRPKISGLLRAVHLHY